MSVKTRSPIYEDKVEEEVLVGDKNNYQVNESC